MKTLKVGDLGVLKAYKYFRCRTCGWIGKADKDEYIYHDDGYPYVGYYTCQCPYCNNFAYEVKENDAQYQMIKEMDLNVKS